MRKVSIFWPSLSEVFSRYINARARKLPSNLPLADVDTDQENKYQEVILLGSDDAKHRVYLCS